MLRRPSQFIITLRARRFREDLLSILMVPAEQAGPISNGGIPMKKSIVATLAAAAAAALVPLTVAQVTSAGATGVKPEQNASGAITIQSWLHSSQSVNGLSGTVVACFKIAGAITDQGGDPNWNGATYEASTLSPANSMCGSAAPVGGYVFVPAPSTAANTLDTVYAVHTITGARGQIFITFSGVYNLTTAAQSGVDPYQGTGTWLITGGTRAYTGLQGDGTWAADASTFPYIRHTETGTIWWATNR
jgi:hypothetical protein